jgi:hypothetical protein
VLHSKRNLNVAEAQAFCQSKHGPWASLAELDTGLEWSTVLNLVKQVGLHFAMLYVSAVL